MVEMENQGFISFKWNNHKSTFFDVLSCLRSTDSFADATIACEGKFYPVHKFVLSACSDYFCEVFERISCRTPVVILKDIKQHDLEALLDYMYLGEVDIHESELTDVIKAAECLKIKGLAVPEDSPSFFSFKRPTSPSERTPSPPAKRVRKTRTSSEDEKKAKVADHTALLTPKTEQSDSDNSTSAISSSPHSRRSNISSRSTLIPRSPPPLANPLSPISPLPSPKNNKTTPTLKFNIKSKSSSKRRACVGNTGSPSTLPKPVKIIKKTKSKAITGRQAKKKKSSPSTSSSSSSLSVGDNHKTFFFKYEEGEDPKASSLSSTGDLQDSKEDLSLNGSTLSSDQAGPSGHAAPNKLDAILAAASTYCDQIGIPAFSPALLPYLEGSDLNKEELSKLSKKMVEELIVHFSLNKMYETMTTNIHRSKFYYLIQLKILDKYPNITVESSKRKKGKKGPLGTMINKLADRMASRSRKQKMMLLEPKEEEVEEKKEEEDGEEEEQEQEQEQEGREEEEQEQEGGQGGPLANGDTGEDVEEGGKEEVDAPQEEGKK